MFNMDHPWGKEIQVCSNNVWPQPRGLNFDIVIDREVLKSSSQEPLGQCLGAGDSDLFK